MADKRAFFNLNTLLSTLDPELRKFAQSIWAGIPDDSVLKTETFERVFGVFKAWAEKRASEMGPLGDVVEKLTDVGDFAVRGSKGVKAAHDWMDKFYAEAAKRLEKATDPRAELKEIKLEFELRQELLKAIEEVRKAAKLTEPERVSIDWSKIQSQYESFLKASARFAAKAVNQTEKTAKGIDNWAVGTATPKVRQLRQFLETKGIRRGKPKGRLRLWLERRRVSR